MPSARCEGKADRRQHGCVGSPVKCFMGSQAVSGGFSFEVVNFTADTRPNKIVCGQHREEVYFICIGRNILRCRFFSREKRRHRTN